MLETKWSIRIKRTEVNRTKPENSSFEMPIEIILTVPLQRNPLDESAANPVEITKIKLRKPDTKEMLCEYSLSHHSATSEHDEDWVHIKYSLSLSFKLNWAEDQPINELAESLVIDVFDSTSESCPLSFGVTELVGPSASGVYRKFIR